MYYEYNVNLVGKAVIIIILVGIKNRINPRF